MIWAKRTLPWVWFTLSAARTVHTGRLGLVDYTHQFGADGKTPDGTSFTSPTCVVAAVSFNGKKIRTVEGHAKDGELTALQKSFIEHFAFQCGYCTPGFLNEGQVLLERLAKNPVARADLEKTITEALDGHLCRCTGYIKYHEAVRDVILADPERYLI